MRYFLSVLFVALPSFALAQEEKKFKHPEIKKISVGFQAYDERDPAAYKVGMWTPVHVEVFGGTNGIKPKGDRHPYIEIETTDSEDVGTRIRVPVIVDEWQTRTFTGYVKTGHMARNSDIPVTLHEANGRESRPKAFEQFASVDIDAHLYLTIGAKITDLHRAIANVGAKGDEKEELRRMMDSATRRVAYELDVERLPERWFGYNSVDVIILSTENKKFIEGLENSPGQLEALAKWVRRGGRLIIPVAWQRQDGVSSLLRNAKAWAPPIPVVPPRDAGNAVENAVKRLTGVEIWAGMNGQPFQRTDPKDPLNKLPIPIATLDPGRVPPGDWEVLAEVSENDKRPLIARVRYGLGQIVYLAFSLEDPAFFNWEGKQQFLQTMMAKLAPRAPEFNEKDMDRRFRGRGEMPNDLTTDLIGQLEAFDVTVVKFGYVALFIVLYILVVGPLDFVLLKYVFKRLEWTWITFPSVVLGVSVVAYFSAYALKGRDLKINKVDIVDFDMRYPKDSTGQPRAVHAYGHSFFSILSPRIQNYTVGLEPNPKFWGDSVRKVPLRGGEQGDEVLSVDSLSWLARPSGGPHDMRRPGSSGFFRKPYTFREDGSGLEGVPIPVWTTKAFMASWEQPLTKAPFKIDLVYHSNMEKSKGIKVSGKLENHLGVDLVDVWLIFANQCHPIPAGLKRVQPGAPAAAFALAERPRTDVRAWASQNALPDDVQVERAWSANPSAWVKQLLFHEKFDTTNNIRNHLLRPLDLGWRIDKDWLDHRRTREAILFARVRSISGDAKSVTRNETLPTKLWLGDLPDNGIEFPDPFGFLNQETFIRVLLPVRPADE